MPGFNGTGPMGYGPMTGGARGFCNPRGSRSYYAYAPFWYGAGRGGFPWGGGRGRTWGGGRGWWWRTRAGFPYPPGYAVPPYAPLSSSHPASKEEEIQGLRAHSEMLQQELEGVQARLSELESAKQEDSPQ
jgi:hypothetical protein